MIRHYLLPIALVVLLSSIGTAQQPLPAGTRSATDDQQQSPTADLTNKAIEALDKQDYPTAEKLLVQITTIDPKNAGAFYQLGAVREILNNDAGAEAAYRSAVSIDPKQFESRLALGLLLARSGKATAAREQLAITITPESNPVDTANAAKLKATAYRALTRIDLTNNPTAARDELVAALKLTPETPDDTALAAQLAKAAKDNAGAESAYKRLATAPDASPEAVTTYARYLQKNKQYDEEKILLDKAIEAHPDDLSLVSQLASLYGVQGKSSESLPLIEKLHTTHPNDPAINRMLARIYMQAGQSDKADPIYEKLLTQSPKDPVLLDERASSLVLQQRFADAEALLKQAVATPAVQWPSPDDFADVAGHLAFAASRNHDPNTVLQALDMRGTVLPPSPATLFLAATAHDTLHHRDQAIALYHQFLKAAAGQLPDQEWQASHRLIALEHK